MAAIVAHVLAGETVDALVWRVLGSATVEPVLEANPGLAAAGPFLPEGQAVTLPEIVQAPAAAAELVQLWD